MHWPVAPMLLTDETRAPDVEPGVRYEVKWDGLRTLLRIAAGQVEMRSRTGRDRTARFPELQAVATQVACSEPLVLDAELVVIAAGQVRFSQALARDRSADPRTIATKAVHWPATLMLFDLLAIGERSLLHEPLAVRQERLRLLVTSADAAQIVEGVTDGPSLFATTAAAGMEGIVGKRLDSRYEPGVRTPTWRKYKHRREQRAVVVGLSPPQGRPTAMHLAACDEQGQLCYIGKVGSGLSTADALELARSLAPAPGPPCIGVSPRAPVRWVQPMLTVRVGYLEWTEHLHLRQPSLLGWSTIEPEQCRLP